MSTALEKHAGNGALARPADAPAPTAGALQIRSGKIYEPA